MHKKPTIILGLLLAAASIGVLNHFGTSAFGFESNPSANADCTLEVRIDEFKHYCDFSGTTLTPMIRAHVTCTNNDTQEQVVYEDLWYRGSDFIGCRRYNNLPIKQQCTTDLKMNFDRLPCTSESSGAAANCAARLLLDCNLNLDTLTRVDVPSEAYPLVCEGLQRGGFRTYAEAFRTVTANIPLNLHSSDGKGTMFLYGETR